MNFKKIKYIILTIIINIIFVNNSFATTCSHIPELYESESIKKWILINQSLEEIWNRIKRYDNKSTFKVTDNIKWFNFDTIVVNNYDIPKNEVIFEEWVEYIFFSYYDRDDWDYSMWLCSWRFYKTEDVSELISYINNLSKAENYSKIKLFRDIFKYILIILIIIYLIRIKKKNK